MKYFWLIICLTSLVACSDDSKKGAEVYKAEIEKIDSFSSQLETEVKAFRSLDSAKIVQTGADYEEMKRVLQAYYKVDTIDQAFASKVNMLKSLKDAKHYPDNHKRFLKEADYTMSQLKDLKHDLEHSSIEEDEVEEAMTLESKGAKEIIAVLHSYTELLTKNLAIYDSLNPQVQIVVDSLRNLHEGNL